MLTTMFFSTMMTIVVFTHNIPHIRLHNGYFMYLPPLLIIFLTKFSPTLNHDHGGPYNIPCSQSSRVILIVIKAGDYTLTISVRTSLLDDLC